MIIADGNMKRIVKDVRIIFVLVGDCILDLRRKLNDSNTYCKVSVFRE